MQTENAPLFSITLILLTGDKAPEGPGWYITGTAQDLQQGENIPPRRIAVPDAEDIARSFEQYVPTNQEYGGIRPFQLIRQGTEKAREAVNQELARAEQIATTVPRLRKALGELGDT